MASNGIISHIQADSQATNDIDSDQPPSSSIESQAINTNKPARLNFSEINPEADRISHMRSVPIRSEFQNRRTLAKRHKSNLPRIRSEPAVRNALRAHRRTARHRRKSTVLHPSEHYDAKFVLDLIVSQPQQAYIGIVPNLRPIIEGAIKDLKQQTGEKHQELFEEALTRLETDEMKRILFKSGAPLEASIANFEAILQQKYTRTLIYATCHALTGSFLAGFNTSLLNVPAKLVQSQCNLSLDQFSLLQSMYCVGGLIGALFAGCGADRYGRKITLLFANSMFMASGIVSMLYATSMFGAISIPQYSFIYFILSRILSGIASGISTAIVPTYLGEISPPIIRGEIGTLNAFINAFGILFAEIISFDYLLGGISTWPFIFIVNVIPTAVQIGFIRTLCESPQWLLYNNKREAARAVFVWLRQSDNVLFDMRSIKTKKLFDEKAKTKIRAHTPSPARRKPQNMFPLDADNTQMNNAYIEAITPIEIIESPDVVPLKIPITEFVEQDYEQKENSALLEWSDQEGASPLNYGTAQHQLDEYEAQRCCSKYLRCNCAKRNCTPVLSYIFFMTICLQILQQFSGINSVWYYSSIMLENAGLTSSFQLWIGNILIASSNFFGVLIPVKLIEKLGRKLLIYLSCAGMILAELCLSCTLWFAEDIGSYAGYLSIIILILYVLCFAMGLGPIVGLLTVELSPSSHRGTIVSAAFCINYLSNLFVAQFANQVVEYIYYIPFAAVCSFGIVFTYFFIPETKGKKENDIQMEIFYRVTKSEPLDNIDCDIYG